MLLASQILINCAPFMRRFLLTQQQFCWLAKASHRAKEGCVSIKGLRTTLTGFFFLLGMILAAPPPVLASEASPETVERSELLVFLQEKPEDALLVDVRPVEEFVAGHLPGAVNIPLERIARVLPRLQKYEQIIFYCNFGFVSEKAQALAREAGLQQTRYLKKTVSFQPDGSFEIR